MEENIDLSFYCLKTNCKCNTCEQLQKKKRQKVSKSINTPQSKWKCSFYPSFSKARSNQFLSFLPIQWAKPRIQFFYLICSFLISETERLFICLWGVCFSLRVNFLFTFFAIVSSGLFVFRRLCSELFISCGY